MLHRREVCNFDAAQIRRESNSPPPTLQMFCVFLFATTKKFLEFDALLWVLCLLPNKQRKSHETIEFFYHRTGAISQCWWDLQNNWSIAYLLSALAWIWIFPKPIICFLQFQKTNHTSWHPPDIATLRSLTLATGLIWLIRAEERECLFEEESRPPFFLQVSIPLPSQGGINARENRRQDNSLLITCHGTFTWIPDPANCHSRPRKVLHFSARNVEPFFTEKADFSLSIWIFLPLHEFQILSTVTLIHIEESFQK